MTDKERGQESKDAQEVKRLIAMEIALMKRIRTEFEETLFPYIRTNLKDYIEKNWENAEVKEIFEKLKEQAKKDEADKIEGVVAIAGATPVEEKKSLEKNVLWQMDNDRNSGAFQQLQDHMYRHFKSSVKVVEKEDKSKTIVEVKKTETKPIEEPTKVEVKKDSPAESEKKIEKITEPEKNGIGEREQVCKDAVVDSETADSFKKMLTLEPLPPHFVPVQKPTLINENKLSDFKQILDKNGIISELSKDVLWCCDYTIAIYKDEAGKVYIDGCYSVEAYIIGDLCKEHFGTIKSKIIR